MPLYAGVYTSVSCAVLYRRSGPTFVLRRWSIENQMSGSVSVELLAGGRLDKNHPEVVLGCSHTLTGRCTGRESNWGLGIVVDDPAMQCRVSQLVLPIVLRYPPTISNRQVYQPT